MSLRIPAAALREVVARLRSLPRDNTLATTDAADKLLESADRHIKFRVDPPAGSPLLERWTDARAKWQRAHDAAQAVYYDPPSVVDACITQLDVMLNVFDERIAEETQDHYVSLKPPSPRQATWDTAVERARRVVFTRNVAGLPFRRPGARPPHDAM